jgi:acetolactate synthase I/II/III large subunit
MNGAEAIVHTLLAGGVEVCFANPGTSEMHFVVALDRIEGMRCVLGLFEGVVTGAADGYARMAGKPAATLLHLGPGLGNGLANLHNARRAASPIVNIVGEHATYHLAHDAPLTSDIEGIARPVSGWVRRVGSARSAASDTAEAITASRMPPGQIATLILPADAAWEPAEGATVVEAPPARPEVADEAVRAAAIALRGQVPALLVLGGAALGEAGLAHAGRIAAATGCGLIAQMSNARLERGAGRVAIDRVPYPVDQAVARLGRFRRAILAGAHEPVAFFAYPDKPSRLLPPDCEVLPLALPGDDVVDALARLADELGAAGHAAPLEPRAPPQAPRGSLTPESIAAAVGHVLPENAIVTDESVSTGRGFFAQTRSAAPHSWLQVTGGAIGLGLPLAVGAAIACPDRPVLSLEADGSAMYTLQALWTQAREGLDVTTLILANQSYAILKGEMANVGARNPGRRALDMLTLDRPTLDWVALAQGMGVRGERVEDAQSLTTALGRGLATPGPYLVEAVF